MWLKTSAWKYRNASKQNKKVEISYFLKKIKAAMALN